MQISITKKFICHIIALIVFVSLVAYIGWDTWRDFKIRMLNQAYNQGAGDTVNALIKQAQQCNAIPVSSGTTTIQVINTACLQQAPAEGVGQ